MRSERHSSDELNFVSRLERDPRFAVAFLNRVLGKGEGRELAQALSLMALALDDIELSPEAIDPEEARIVLERLQAILRRETREIVLV